MSESVVQAFALQQHRSPGVTAIYNELKASRVNHVLDLGPSSAKSFNFFTQLSCKIRFENLNECLIDPYQKPRSGDELRAALAAYLNEFHQAEKFDVVLTWDLFNYLDMPTIEWLIARLSPFCRPNALLHTVKYVSANIPSCPRTFQILDQHQLTMQQTAELDQRYHASHETARLLRFMPHFYIENSYLNFDGMVPGLVEQVLRYQPEKALGLRRMNSDELAQNDNYISRQKTLARQPHQSAALEKVLQPKMEGTQPAILDLGLKNKNNYDQLYGLTQCLYAENIYQELQIQSKSQSEPQFKPHMLNFPTTLQFDVILTWDILNFLPLILIEDLFDKLALHIHAETFVHAIVYSGRETPASPQQFQLLSASDLEIYPSDKQPGVAPLTSTRLLKAMKIFHLQETFVFRPGMQRGIYEYLFQQQQRRL